MLHTYYIYTLVYANMQLYFLNWMKIYHF